MLKNELIESELLRTILDSFTDEYVSEENIKYAKVLAPHTVIDVFEEEIWKPVIYNDIVVGRYMVSSWGRVHDLNLGRLLSYHIGEEHYFRVALETITPNNNKNRATIRIHRLVATMFLPLIDGKTYVNHLDSNRQNNFYKNLEWTTNTDNIKHGHLNGSLDNKGGYTYFTPQEIETIRLKYKRGVTIKVLSEEYNRDRRAMSNIVNYVSYTDEFWVKIGYDI